MTIDILLVKHPAERPSPVIPEMIDHLEKAGVAIRPIYPDLPHQPQPTPEHTDLLVLKAKTPAALEVAAGAHAAGIPTFTPYPVTALCRDKVETTRALQRHGVPVPQTWNVTDPLQMTAELDDGPLIFKPLRGSQGRGIEIVHSVEELHTLAQADQGEELMVQRYYAPDGLDRKIYRIGDEVFCVERVFPPTTYQDKLGRLITLPPAVEEVARSCGDALGIDTYGVDIILHDGEPYVVDLSSFPGFKGVPDAGRRLADRILAALPDS